jgi:hypothetical protein
MITLLGPWSFLCMCYSFKQIRMSFHQRLFSLSPAQQPQQLDVFVSLSSTSSDKTIFIMATKEIDCFFSCAVSKWFFPGIEDEKLFVPCRNLVQILQINCKKTSSPRCGEQKGSFLFPSIEGRTSFP